MRFDFLGKRETGEPVEGRVTAANPDAARAVLAGSGIIADVLEALPDEAQSNPAPVRVSFDFKTRGYQARSLSAADHDRIRDRLVKLVDDGLLESLMDDSNRHAARHHIVDMLEKVLARPDLPSEQSPWFQALESKVRELTGAVGRIERTMRSAPAPARSRRNEGNPSRQPRRTVHDEILMKVFESNLELIQGLKDPALAGTGEETS